MFEKASRLKLRFDSPKGLLSTEDLWDLPLTSARGVNLNDLAKAINRELKDTTEEDFVNAPTTSTNSTLQLKLDLVKHVIAVRQAENEKLRLEADKRQKKAQILELIERKQNQALEGKSLEELQEMVNTL